MRLTTLIVFGLLACNFIAPRPVFANVAVSGISALVARIEGRGGTIVPCADDGGPGTLTFGGDYLALGGLLEIRVAGDAGGFNHSVLHVTDTALLAGDFQLKLVFQNGYQPQLGDEYDVLTARQTIGEFQHVECNPLPPGLTLDIENRGDRIRVTVIKAQPVTASPHVGPDINDLEN